MKIRQIKAFLAVVHTGSVRRAADRLCLTQSTVAKAVSQLEFDLGTPLFDRSAQGLRLNAAGQSLLPYAETIATNADRAAQAVAAVAAGRQRILRASVTPTLPPEILAEAVGRFRSRYPDVKLQFTSGFLSDCLPKLLTDKIDLSLVMIGRHQEADVASLVEEPLFFVDQGVVGAVDHRLFSPGADVREVLSECEWLSTLQDENFLRERLEAFGLPAPRSLTLCDFYGVDALNGRNDALSLSPLSVVEDARYVGRLRALDPELFPLPPLCVSFFTRRGIEPSPQADFLRHSIRETFASWYRERPRRFVREAGASTSAV